MAMESINPATGGVAAELHHVEATPQLDLKR